MKWSLAELHRYQNEPLHIQSTFDLNASLTKLFPDIILGVAPVKVDGYVTYDDGDATISANVKTTLTVPSSRSLTPVQLPLDFDFSETYIDDRSHFSRYEDDEVVFLLQDRELIDFDTALAENIVEQVPGLTPCPNCGELRKSHMVCPNCGYYDGKQVVNTNN